jgi:AraC-like DNA-binding protein
MIADSRRASAQSLALRTASGTFIMSLAFDNVTGIHDGARLDGFPKIADGVLRAFDRVFRIRPPVRPNLTLAGKDIQGLVYTLGKLDTTEMEFSLPSHVVLMFPDGISGGCEWSSSSEAGRLSVVAPNTVLFSPAKEYLFFRKRKSQAQCRMLLLAIPPAILNRVIGGDDELTQVRFNQQIALDDAIISQALVAIQQEIESPGPNSTSYVDCLLMLLLNRLIRCASNLATSSVRPRYAKGGLAHWRLKQAVQLLESDSTKAPLLSEIAELINLHPTSFCRAFKQSTGVPPHRYLLIHRTNQAKRMMEDRDRTLTQIALDCGFSSSSQFSAAFKRIVGVSPRAFRREL